MCVAVCERCSCKFVVSRVRQKWEVECPKCHGKLLREEELKHLELVSKAKRAIEMSRKLRRERG